MIYLTRLTVTSSYPRGVLPAMLVMGLGFGMIFAPAINTAKAGVRREDSGVAHHTGALGPAIAATHGYTLAFTVSAALLGLGVILAVTLLPSRHRLEELRNIAAASAAAAAPAAAPALVPAPQLERHALPVALCGCSPVIVLVKGSVTTTGSR